MRRKRLRRSRRGNGTRLRRGSGTVPRQTGGDPWRWLVVKVAALSPGSALRRLPISLRLGATFAVLFLVVLAGLSAVAYWGLGRSLRAEIDRSLVTAVNTLGDRPGLTDI